jgi:hypothetical protein
MLQKDLNLLIIQKLKQKQIDKLLEDSKKKSKNQKQMELEKMKNYYTYLNKIHESYLKKYIQCETSTTSDCHSMIHSDNLKLDCNKLRAREANLLETLKGLQNR